MKFYYEIETFVEDEKIQHSVYSVFNGIREKVSIEMMNMKEEATRKSLIELGWTPPEESK